MNTREKVIAALEKTKGNYISGEALARDCQVSRNAIWKIISELRKNGYEIKSVNNKGYMLEGKSDIISKAGICMYLESISGCLQPGIADKIYVYDLLDSTNNEAKRSLLFNDGHMIHGTYIIAKQQSAGKGHGGTGFFSPLGGIYLSMILGPGRIKNKYVPVTELAASAVSSVIEKLFDVKINKLGDNSLYVGNDKVCGILTEGICDLETGIFSNYITGIGIRADLLQNLQETYQHNNKIIAVLIKALNEEMST